jgi:hypothetical protein
MEWLHAALALKEIIVEEPWIGIALFVVGTAVAIRASHREGS